MRAHVAESERLRPLRRRRGIQIEPYLWVAPAVLVFFVFTLLPLVVGFGLSFVSWDGINPLRLVGLRNYLDVLHDGEFWQAVEHNAI